MDRRGRTRAALIFVALLAALIAGCGSGSDGPGTTTGKGDTYTLVLPGSYDEIGDLEAAATKEAADKSLEELGSEPEFDLDSAFAKDAEDGFATNVNVSTEPLPEGIDLAEYRDITVRNAPRIGLEVDSGPEATTLGGEPAFQITASAERDGKSLRFRAISSVHGGLGYSLTLTALADHFAEADAEFTGIAESFTWTD